MKLFVIMNPINILFILLLAAPSLQLAKVEPKHCHSNQNRGMLNITNYFTHFEQQFGEHNWIRNNKRQNRAESKAFLDGGLSGTTISNIFGDSLTEFEAVLKEIEKERALLLEEIENANIVITKIIGANCYPFLLDMAVVLAGWMIPIIVPPLYLTTDFIEYLKCVLEHKDKSDCTYLLDTADNYLKGLPIVFKEFLEDYLQVIEDVPTTFNECITPMN